VLFDIGNVISGFPFVVILSSKRKADTDPDGVVALLKGMKRGLDFLKTDKERVAGNIIKSNKFGDPTTIRKVVNQFSTVFSIAITKEDIDSLFVAAHIEAEAKKLGGAEKFFARSLLTKALSQNR